MELSLVALVVAAAATVAGASIQSAIGFGMNLVTVPVLAVVLPEALPAAVIMLGLPMSVAMLRHEHAAVDRPGTAWILAGRVPGTVAGTWVVAGLSTDALRGVVGMVVLLLVLASLTTPPLPVQPSTQVVAGMVSGLTGTAAGIGGPPLALLYQRHPGPTMRATLAAAFCVGTVLSLVALGVAGTLTRTQLGVGLLLAPLVVVGSLLGRRAHAVLDRGWLRPGVLAFSTVSAAAVVVDALR